jgi:hypothetical protein
VANTFYPKGKEAFASASINWSSDTIKIAPIKITGTGAVSYSAAHQFWSDISSGVVGTPQTLGTKSITNGKLTGAAVTFTALSSAGNTLGYAVYKDTGTPSTSPLICWLDAGTNVPVTPNGSDVTFTPDGTNGILTL